MNKFIILAHRNGAFKISAFNTVKKLNNEHIKFRSKPCTYCIYGRVSSSNKTLFVMLRERLKTKNK